MSLQDILLRLFSIFLLIGINAFFVTTEFAIVSVRRSRINHLVLEGDIPAKTVQSLHRSLDRLLSTTQLGITLSSLALGWIGEDALAIILQNFIINLPFSIPLTEVNIHIISIPIAFVFLVYLQIVLGELFPKSLALLYSEQIARFLAPASLVIGRVFNPFIEILNESTRLLLKLIGIEYTDREWHKQVTSEELQLIINTEKESSGLEAEERELLNNVFEFGDVEAKEVMTPYVNITTLPKDATGEDLLKAVAETSYSRYPITGESLDDIQGMVDLKDFACGLAKGKFTLETPIIKLKKSIRFFDESMLLSELLPLMQRSRFKMVMMVDKYGSISGLITRQDLINEIIGEETDNNLNKPADIIKIDEQTYLVSAQINVEELNEELNLNLPLIADYQTLAGFLLYQWQKIPQQGETFKFDSLNLTVIKADENKLHQIKIRRSLTINN